MSYMDYYPVSYWDEEEARWVECGRWYRNALVIDYNLISDEQFDLNMFVDESVFAAPRYDIDNWIDAPGSSTWPAPKPVSNKKKSMSLHGKQPAAGLCRNDEGSDFHFGVDLPATASEIWAYRIEGLEVLSPVFGPVTKLYEWKMWDFPLTLSALFDVYHESINVKDISRLATP